MDAGTIVGIVLGVISVATLFWKISSGFTLVQMGQTELKSDFEDLKADMKNTNAKLVEMEKDLVWVQASTQTPPRRQN